MTIFLFDCNSSFGTSPLFSRLFRPFLSLMGQVCTWFVNSPNRKQWKFTTSKKPLMIANNCLKAYHSLQMHECLPLTNFPTKPHFFSSQHAIFETKSPLRILRWHSALHIASSFPKNIVHNPYKALHDNFPGIVTLYKAGKPGKIFCWLRMLKDIPDLSWEIVKFGHMGFGTAFTLKPTKTKGRTHTFKTTGKVLQNLQIGAGTWSDGIKTNMRGLKQDMFFCFCDKPKQVNIFR